MRRVVPYMRARSSHVRVCVDACPVSVEGWTSTGGFGKEVSMSDKRLLYLMNDFVVQEHVCNLRCLYCLNFENELKGTQPWVPVEQIDLNTGGKGFTRALQVLELCRRKADAPILRISGGEILAIAGGVSFIEQTSANWEKVQILTNATLLGGETLERLSAISSINLCCSIDGHTPELNSLRTRNPRLAQSIIDGVLGAIKAGIPVEINTVLTGHNIEALYDFACYLADLPRTADLRLIPFPVRGKVADDVAPSAEQLTSLYKLLDDYGRFESILPPRAYLERLCNFYEHARRTFRCHVPLAFIQSFDDGVIASCSNCWAVSLGNLLEDENVFHQIGEAKIHKLFLRPRPRVPFCQSCFTPFDIVNVYLDDECSLDEIASMDLYSSSSVRDRLMRLRAAWEARPPKGLWG